MKIFYTLVDATNMTVSLHRRALYFKEENETV
jgi:hypothetical protein